MTAVVPLAPCLVARSARSSGVRSLAALAGPGSRSGPGSGAAGFLFAAHHPVAAATAAFDRITQCHAWTSARSLARAVYAATAAPAFLADPSLRDQMRRAARSAMANIAEGFARGTDRGFARFLDIARASLAELSSDCHLAADVGLLADHLRDDLLRTSDEVVGRIARLTSYLRASR